MSEPANQPDSTPPISTFTGPVAELIAQRMLQPPSRPGMLAVLDHFEILRVLGSGGMGIVLLARDSSSGRDVAIKLVKSDLVTNQQIVQRFLKEAGHLKRLRHTNIVPVQEISDRPEAPYFVMPFFEKGSFAGRIKPGQSLNAATILDIAMQVAEALSFAHRSGIIHRDLKPANVLLGANGQVCLADFGLARTMFNDTVVDVGSQQVEGTAPYMSPAVAAGDAEDTRCDIYSFGAVLYEMLTGYPPYQGRGGKEILNQILAGPPKAINTVNPAADPCLTIVAEKAMARELRDRYADMRDVLKDLALIKDGKPPIGLRNTSSFPPFLKVVAILAFIVIVAGLGWKFWPAPAPAPLPTPTTLPVPATAPVPVVTVPPPMVHPAPVNTPAPAPSFTTLAGQVGNSGSIDGTGTQAQFHLPNNIAVDHSGNLYVADTGNNTIRKITSDGVVTTLAGFAGLHGNTDGTGNQSRFWAPFGIAVDASGNVFVADTANNTIREITPTGVVSTLAGLAGHAGSNDGLSTAARFRNPWSVAVDTLGNVIVADMSNDAIRKITPTGQVTTLAGQAGTAGASDGIGTQARFNNPFAVAVDATGNIYVSDSANNTIRKLAPDGTVTTLAGLPGSAGSADGVGNAARFSNPQGLAVDAAGNIYVADTGNSAIRKITPSGMVTTLPGGTNNATGQTAFFDSPGGVALDDAGNLYVADSNHHCVRKMALPKP